MLDWRTKGESFLKLFQDIERTNDMLKILIKFFLRDIIIILLIEFN